MESKKSKNINIFLICFSITVCLMIFKKSNIIDQIEEKFYTRILFQSNTLNYVCDNAGNSLQQKYKGGYNEKSLATRKPNKYQQAIINFARNSKFNNIKPYIPRLAIFFAFLALAILFIFCWIGYFVCCCCSCCCFQEAYPHSRCKRTIWFLIAAVCSFLVMGVSFLLLFLIKPFLRKVNGVACSTFTLVDHFRDGLQNSYPAVTNRWGGIPAIEDALKKGQTQYKKITDYSQLEKDIKYAIDNITSIEETDKCGLTKAIKSSDLKNELNNITNIVNSSLKVIDFDQQINDIKETYEIFTDTEDKACKDVYNVLHDYINKYIKIGCYLFFILTLAFGLLGFLILILYYPFKSDCLKFIYVFIWNISMLLSIICILLSVVLGVLSYVSYDGIPVIQYIISPDNLNNEKPLFIKSNSYVSKTINVCCNGDGDFLEVIQENNEINKAIEKLNEKTGIYNSKINQLKRLNCTNQDDTARKSILKVYDTLLQKKNDILNTTSLLTNISRCDFAKNDERIILKQIDSTAKRAKIISFLSFALGILLGISVLAGIMFIHRHTSNNITYDQNQMNNLPNYRNETTTNIYNEQVTSMPIDNKF